MKRHTILLTVLINAGLLLVLFATAIHPSEKREKVSMCAPEAPPPFVYEPPIKPVKEVTPSIIETPIAAASVEPRATAPPQVAPAVESVVAMAPKLVEITVKQGDSLDKIARGNGTTIDALVSTNELKTTRLQIGQVLKVPLSGSKPAKPSVKQAVIGDEETYYVVRSGDNPWLIAMKHRIPLEELLKVNNLNEESARKLKPGDKIRVKK